MATYYIDLENGNDSNNGTSFAQRRKTIESFKDADAAGDEYRIMASPDPTLVGSCTMPERWAFENYSGNTIDCIQHKYWSNSNNKMGTCFRNWRYYIYKRMYDYQC